MTEATARKRDVEAVEQIASYLQSYVEGGPDREAECLDLARRCGLNPGSIQARWTKARDDRRTAELAAQQMRKAKTAVAAIKATALATVPEPTPPKPKPDPAPVRIEPDAPPVLNPNAPYDIAGEYIHRHCLEAGQCVLWHWQGQFYRWSGRVYEAVPDDVMRGQVYRFLDRARRRSGEELIRFQPRPGNVSDVIDALKSQLALGIECQPPMWLEARKAAKDWVVFQNGIVNMLTEEVRPLTPDLWVHNSLGFDWNDQSRMPRVGDLPRASVP